MTRAWVLGSGGLLGSALCRALRQTGSSVYAPTAPLVWGCEGVLARQIRDAVCEFAASVRGDDRWEIYWAAGVGVMSSAPDELAPETRALGVLLDALRTEVRLRDRPGLLAFASSAGAIYAGAGTALVDESTPAAPTTAYAREKLSQEEAIASFVAGTPAVEALIARISTLYGPGQSQMKGQGLLTQIARSILRGDPVRIYVPLDTSRDYISSDDAANALVSLARAGRRKERLVMKIVASERSTTIAEILATFKRLSRRSPRIITASRPLAAAYPRLVRFRSVIGPPAAAVGRTSLLIGMAQLLAAERMRIVAARQSR